ncbi:MAG TPA: hypothetical protein VGX37_08150 [Allosphingosinicella sp.]|jgi:hypothetical protein|nr:hypothetical protein [Allosphingosinicella sp.]
MNDPALLVALGSAGTLAVSAAAGAALKGWQGWLEIRRMQAGRAAVRRPSAGARTDLADLKARVRRLEAIAHGGEL